MHRESPQEKHPEPPPHPATSDGDGVSGATESSAGFLAAIDDVPRKARTAW
ncbi:MAG: FMN-binding protein [Treponema sp.]|nr:FMN-binding protein [Treponema sp.]